MARIIDLTGQKFGRLTVIKRIENKGKYTNWLCKCDCGNQTEATSHILRKGEKKSCGCLHREFIINKNKVHEKSNTRLYRIYVGMKQRCYKVSEPCYKYYGGRGIKICNEWLQDFMSFYNWAIANGYKENLTIDRIDVNGNYEPNNCRWATRKEQMNNMRTNRLLTYKGITKNISEWAKEYKIPYDVLQNRITKHGWSIERALTQPVKHLK